MTKSCTYLKFLLEKWPILNPITSLLGGLIFCSCVSCSFSTVEAAIHRKWTPSRSSIPLYDGYWFTVSANWWLWWEINLWWSMVVSPTRYSLFLQGLQSYYYCRKILINSRYFHWWTVQMRVFNCFLFHYVFFSSNILISLLVLQMTQLQIG